MPWKEGKEVGWHTVGEAGEVLLFSALTVMSGKASVSAAGQKFSGGVGGKGNVEPIQNDILGKPRTGSALKVDEVKPIYKVDPKTGKQYTAQEFPAGIQAHGFNNMVDNYAGYATKSHIPNGEIYQLEGALNGVDGRFEWIVQDGNVTHRMFIQNGTMNGVPIRP